MSISAYGFLQIYLLLWYLQRPMIWYVDNLSKNNSNEIFPVQSINLVSSPVKKNTTIFYIIDTVLILAIVFMLIFALPKTGKTTTSSTKTKRPQSSANQTNNQSLPSPTKNPLNNGPINSEIQYCSNPVNAELVC